MLRTLAIPLVELGADLEADDMYGDIAFRRELGCENAGVTAAAFPAVGKKDDDAWLLAHVERVDSEFDRVCQRRLADRGQIIDICNDAWSCITQRFETKIDIAAGIFRARTKDDQPHFTKWGHLRYRLFDCRTGLFDTRAGKAIVPDGGH